jgi:hypothetical protein
MASGIETSVSLRKMLLRVRSARSMLHAKIRLARCLSSADGMS